MILTDRLLRNLRQTNIEPIMVLEIQDVPFLISSGVVGRYGRYGDEGLEYGQPGVVYGGLVPFANQKNIISLEGTTTQIRQNLSPDKARGSGISQMSVALLDKNQEATKLLSGAYGEVLNKKVKVWISFGQSGWKEDYILIFRGIIESASAEQGLCKIFLNAPQQKQRQLIAPKIDTELDGAIDNSQTTITLASTANLITVPEHPFYGGKDPGISTYVLIDDEFIQYDSINGLDLEGCTRGALNTVAVAHSDEAEVTSFYEVTGHAMDIALKVMLSDQNQTPYIEDLECETVNFNGVGVEPNTFFFSDTDFFRDYNVQIGDYVKSSDFSYPANNLSAWTEVLDVVKSDGGSYVLVDAALNYETGASGKVSFLSKWNSFGGFGVGMDTDEVDIDRHLSLKASFLSGLEMRFWVRDEIEDAREWIEREIYLPASCYSLPSDREGLSRISLGIHKAPIPGTSIVTFNKRNITNPQSISVKRSINKYHYNAIAFLYEDSPADEELRKRVITTVGTPSVPTGNKALVIESKGLKDFYNARVLAEQTSERLLERYKSAAETIEGLAVHFRDGVRVTVGDIVLLDPTDLNILNREGQDRNREPLLMEVVDRSVDIKNGSVKLDLIQTNFDVNARYGNISPASRVSSVLSANKFVITYYDVPGPFGVAEYRNWQSLNQPAVRLRKQDFSLVHESRILIFAGNTVTIEDNCPWAIQPGDILEFAPYTNADTIDAQKLVYAYITDGTNPFPDGGDVYIFI